MSDSMTFTQRSFRDHAFKCFFLFLLSCYAMLERTTPSLPQDLFIWKANNFHLLAKPLMLNTKCFAFRMQVLREMLYMWSTLGS